MVVPLLDFAREVELYDAKTITKQKIKVMLKTNLIDLIVDEYAKFPDDSEMQEDFKSKQEAFDLRRNDIFDKIDHEPDNVKLVAVFFRDSDLIDEIKSASGLTVESLASHGVSSEALDAYYKFSKFKYECGLYDDADSMLSNFLSVAQHNSSALLGARWGRLACRILGAKWELAASDLAAIKEAIDIRNMSAIDQLRQRAWLLHWALFVNINLPSGQEALADFFNEKPYLSTIENICPWLLRYYAAFVVLSPSRRKALLPQVLTEIQSMSYQYSDPMTQFLTLVYVDFDFDEAQNKLVECLALMKSDFFLQVYGDKFLREARLLICEVYCTINSRVDLVQLASQLQLTVEEAEKWMVEIVVNSKTSVPINAKIDSAAKVALIAPSSKATFQGVVDKTKDLSSRTGTLASNLGTVLQEQSPFIKAKLWVA